MPNIKKNLFILSGPSGAGEDSIIEGLRKIFSIEKIITTTTRDMRPGEVEGKDYYFISKGDFLKKIKENGFFEWAEEDNGQLYGGTLKEIERVKNSGQVGIWKIDYKGVISAKKLIPEAVSIYIHIPLNEIRERLIKRGTASPEFIKSRLEYAKGWEENKNIFDYKVENIKNKLPQTIEKVANIIKKHLEKA
jgi:guanylate kinase